jgi:hypothetical protein
LSQYDDQGILHLVTFFSKKHIPAEKNYEMYNLELGAILKCHEPWSLECERSVHPIKILTNNTNLENFMISKRFIRTQTRRSEFLSRFKFTIIDCPQKLKQKPDALTRMLRVIPVQGGAEKTQHAVLKTENLDQKIRKGLVVAFTETVNTNNNEVNLEKIQN